MSSEKFTICIKMETQSTITISFHPVLVIKIIDFDRNFKTTVSERNTLPIIYSIFILTKLFFCLYASSTFISWLKHHRFSNKSDDIPKGHLPTSKTFSVHLCELQSRHICKCTQEAPACVRSQPLTVSHFRLVCLRCF